ncbi:MAG: response regulator [Pseudomonadota bacterium]|nr:response regulator [Pseudomonadota bacterium]
MATDDFKRIFESLRVAVVIADAKGIVSYANSAFAQLASHDAHALAGLDLAALFAAEDRKRVQQNLARVGEGKAGSAFLDAMLTPKGKTPHWVSMALQPALDARDKAAGVIAILQDIGSQRETDEALNLVSARLLASAEASPVAMMIETTPGDVELANEAFCKLLGIDSAPQSLSGLPVKEVLARAPGAAKLLERRPILVEDRPAGAVWTPRTLAGGDHPFQKGAADLALIEKIGEELSVALEGMSAISIRAQQMEFDPAIVAHFQSIRTSTETAMAAIGDLVDFSKLSGGVVLHKSQFRLRHCLAELIARVAPNAEEKGCRLRIKVEQDVADALEGDVERLQLVLKNLLDNAFVLMPGAEITLQITPEYVTEAGIQLSFSVVAAGPAARASASKAADAGMGVAVAKFMVVAMGGKLAIATRAGADALYAFTVELPVHPTPPAPARATHASLVTLPVLIVSGDPAQRLQLSNLLRGWRMVPLEADNTPMAMALLERLEEEGSPIPLVILSNRLPVQDGFLLAFRIKHHPKFHATLVMMLATDGKPGDAIACRENGISAYMRYPIGDRQLNEAIVSVTGASADSDETPTLVTRHSLREQRKGATILLVDPNRDSQILAAHVLGRHDCSIVVAQDLAEALAALDQDVYDMVLVDTSLKGLGGDGAAKLLRARITRDPEATRLVATSLEHSPTFRTAKVALGFDTTLAKPFRKDDLLALLAALHREPTAAA